VRFVWKRYRFVDPGLGGDPGGPAETAPATLTDAEAS